MSSAMGQRAAENSNNAVSLMTYPLSDRLRFAMSTILEDPDSAPDSHRIVFLNRYFPNELVDSSGDLYTLDATIFDDLCETFCEADVWQQPWQALLVWEATEQGIEQKQELEKGWEEFKDAMSIVQAEMDFTWEDWEQGKDALPTEQSDNETDSRQVRSRTAELYEDFINEQGTDQNAWINNTTNNDANNTDPDDADNTTITFSSTTLLTLPLPTTPSTSSTQNPTCNGPPPTVTSCASSTKTSPTSRGPANSTFSISSSRVGFGLVGLGTGNWGIRR